MSAGEELSPQTKDFVDLQLTQIPIARRGLAEYLGVPPPKGVSLRDAQETADDAGDTSR